MLKHHKNPIDSELGKKSDYDTTYNPKRLFPIARVEKRAEIGLDSSNLPFYGVDIWNHYEVSWLNSKGKPIVAMAEIIYDCTSPFIIESKSLKLFFNSLNQTKFNHIEDVSQTIQKDIENCVKAPVSINLTTLSALEDRAIQNQFMGICLDELDIACDQYTVEPNFLYTNGTKVKETLHSNLLKSNCLVTNQPDWGSVQIVYEGEQINHEGLLKYLVSFREHNEFHEQCIERIFSDILNQCNPELLSVYGRYTRRGGLEINPFRTTEPNTSPKLIRLVRQ